MAPSPARRQVFEPVIALLQEAAPLAEPSHAFWTGKGRLCFPADNGTAPWDQLPNITISLQSNRSSAFDVTITARVITSTARVITSNSCLEQRVTFS